MPRATVGTFLVGQLRVGQNSYEFASPQLVLNGEPFAVTVVSDVPAVTLTAKPDLVLRARGISLQLTQALQPGKGVLTLRGKAFALRVSVTVSLPERPRLVLRGVAYQFQIDQSPQLGKAILLLRGRAPRRVGVPALLPTTPLTEILTPSPAQLEELILVPSASEDGEEEWLLRPTIERVA